MNESRRPPLLLAALFLPWLHTTQANLTITEFLAINIEGPADKDESLSPWVEIYNGSPTPANLAGWYLTDDPDDLTKWQIPRRPVPAKDYTLLFVSGKDFASLFNPEVHANFTLTDRDDYLALIEPDGTTIASEYKDIPRQRKGISYGLSVTGQPSFFKIPTAMEPNHTPLAGFVADTEFSRQRGFFGQPFQVEITTETLGAHIIYTTSGREPADGTLFRGPIEHVYTGPITIDETTVLRAAAFKEGLGPSRVRTQTYLFLDDVVRQSTLRKQITESERYGSQVHDALSALPSICLAVENPDFVGKGGSNTNDVESPTSVEWLNPDGSEGFQVDAGVSRFGGYYTDFAKKSFRIYMRKRYGEAILKYPIFRGHENGKPPVEEFDSFNLRSGSHDMQSRGAYMSNRFVDDSMLEMGTSAPHGRFVHLYLNGVYWGQYHLRERWNAAMFAHYFGGSEDDYDAINGNDNFTSDFRAYDGDLKHWRETERLSREGQPWEVLSGRIDLADYLDFMLLWATGNSESEFQAVGSKTLGVPFKFYLKDADGWLQTPSGGRITHQGPGRFLALLRTEGHKDYKIFMADRIHKHYFNDGALTDAANIARLQRRVDEVKVAFIAEAARWNYRSPSSWQSFQDNLLNRHFPGLAATMVERFKRSGLYPNDIIAPHFNQHGGTISPGFLLTMKAGSLFNPQYGDFFYTTDGSDPRLPGGSVSPSALTYDRKGSGITLAQTTTIKARAYHEDQWSPLCQATFHLGVRPKPGDLILTEIHYRPAPPSNAERQAGFNQRSAFEFVELYNTTDQAIELSEVTFSRGIGFSFAQAGTLQLPGGAVTLLVRNRAAFQHRYGTHLPIAGEYAAFKLSDQGETLRASLADGSVLFEITYDDKEPWPEAPDGRSPSLSLIDPHTPGDLNDPSLWQASLSNGGSPGTLSPTYPPLPQDQDGDGLLSTLESALGSSDTDPTSGPNYFQLRWEIHTVEGIADRYWIFETRRDPSNTHTTLTLEISSDLQTWHDADDAFIPLPSPQNSLRWRSLQPVRAIARKATHLRLRAQPR